MNTLTRISGLSCLLGLGIAVALGQQSQSNSRSSSNHGSASSSATSSSSASSNGFSTRSSNSGGGATHGIGTGQNLRAGAKVWAAEFSVGRAGISDLQAKTAVNLQETYLKGLQQRGALVLGGEYVRETVPMAVYFAESPEAAGKIASQSPLVVNFGFTYRVRELNISAGALLTHDRSQQEQQNSTVTRKSG